MAQPEVSPSGLITFPNVIERVQYVPETSLSESWGGKARQLWQEKFEKCGEFVSDSEFLYTGIGGAPGDNGKVPVTVFETGPMVAPIVQLEERFGRIPKMLFLTASCVNTDQLVALRGLAREYKSQGVKKIIVILSAFPHERQDDVFTDKATGKVIHNPIALIDTIDDLRAFGHIDGGLCIQPHSMKLIRYALERDFPMLPLDALPVLIKRAGLLRIINPFELGPDKGRNEEAKIVATILRCPYGSAVKTRDRINFTIPKMDIPQDVLDYIKKNNCSHV
jgi:hypothetical protein